MINKINFNNNNFNHKTNNFNKWEKIKKNIIMKKKIKNIMKMMKIKKLYQKVGMLIFNKILIKNMLNNKKKKINKLN